MTRILRSKDRSGLTIVDVLVVLTLVVLLAALVGPRILGRASEARNSAVPGLRLP